MFSRGLFSACLFSSLAMVAPAQAQCIHGTCGRCDLNGDGCLGWQDTFEFFCQLAGGCGPGSCSDFNNDGDYGADSDIEAFSACMVDPLSGCGRAPNDFCINATNLGSTPGVFPLDLRCSTFESPFAFNPALWGDVWYTWHSTFGGPTRITTFIASDTNISVFTGTTCPSPFTAVQTHNAPLTFTAAANTSYLIRIGIEGSTVTPAAGTFTVEHLCPRPPGPLFNKKYKLTGNGSGLLWSWAIKSPALPPPPFTAIEQVNVGPVTGSSFAVAQAFRNSINSTAAAIGCSTSRIEAKVTFFPATRLALRTREPVQLWVGPGAGPANCLVTTFAACSFNPDIIEEPLSGQDCNGNEWDDTIDIDFGDSADVNGNGIPDECEGGCGSPDFDGDGDSGTDLDIEAFFACLGGDCCATCGSPDFDGDGDSGTDLDIEAFFRVLGGGSC